VKQRLDQLDEKLNQKFYGPEQENISVYLISRG